MINMAEKKRNICVTLRPKTIEILNDERDRIYRETGLVVSLSGIIDMMVGNYGVEKKNSDGRLQTSLGRYGADATESEQVHSKGRS